MQRKFTSVAILGPGMLGGSVALAIRDRMPDCQLSLWGRREGPLEKARALGIDQASTDLEAMVKGAELIVLATPVGVMPEMVRQLIAMELSPSPVITDVGSVKRMVHEMLNPMIEGTGVSFVGSHPMAGSEQPGIDAAKVGLLDGAACLVTNDSGADNEIVDGVEAFWSELGCKVRRMTAEDHDYAVARVSHFPHVLASVGATVGLDFPDIADLCGGGMRDTTRVAAGNPSLWTEILMENRDALQRSMQEGIGDLNRLIEMLQDRDEASLHQYLEEARKRRKLI